MKLKTTLLCVSMAAALCACGGQGGDKNKETAQSGQSSSAPVVLNLAHNLSESHTVHQAIKRFADEVAEKTKNHVQIKIFPNAQLGNETECLEQLKNGVLPMTKVSAPGLASLFDAYHGFGLPYLFKDTEDYYKVMDSQEMKDFFLSSHDSGFVTLTYYTSGARSFYTVNKAVRKPADLEGLKIRVQNMESQIDMMKALGGIPVAMAYGEVYTSLQTGVIDGTENNETALTTGKHGEVCKVYSVDQHAMIPDALVMSSKVFDKLSKEEQQIVLQAAANSTQWHKDAWDKAIAEAVEEAKTKMGVEFVTDVDKEAFRAATASMVEAYSKKYPGVANLIKIIQTAQAK